MTSLTIATEIAKGMLEKGELGTVADANVYIVRLMGVRLVTTTLPRELRSAYAAAVRDGRLGRLPKNGLEPEAFFHPNSKCNAMEARKGIAREKINSLQKVLGRDILEL